jgi:intraflagellar transport protein 140
MAVAWDDADDRLLAVEAHRDRSRGVKDETKKEKEESKSQRESDLSPASAAVTDIEGEQEVEIVMLFATSEYGILLQDSFPRKYPYGPLLSVSVPRIFFRGAALTGESDAANTNSQQRANTSNISAAKVYSKVMRDFIGLESVLDESTKIALIEFSFNLTLGKLDEAYRAVKMINSPSIWENMAQMCVKTKRLDVAEVCLGNMGHARGAAALREAKKDKSATLESNIGILAIQLGLLDDAARLFRESKRFDLLNRLYQSAGLWDKAVVTATHSDRIHLKTTHYHLAKYYESLGALFI